MWKVIIGGSFLSICLAIAAAAQSTGSSQSHSSAAQISDLSKRIDKDYKNASLHYLLGNAYLSVNDRKNAAFQYQICIELDPQLQAGRYAAKALQTLQVMGAKETAGMLRVIPRGSAGERAPEPQVQSTDPLPPKPAIAGVDLVAAPPGQSLTIFGRGFSAVASENIVTIGGVNATLNSCSQTSITCIIPDVPMPTWGCPVVVKTPFGSSNAETINIQLRVLPRGAP